MTFNDMIRSGYFPYMMEEERKSAIKRAVKRLNALYDNRGVSANDVWRSVFISEGIDPNSLTREEQLYINDNL